MEEDMLREADERTAELVMELANTICPYLQMEVDFPSRSPTGWMPILNLQVRMADDNTVDFKWYGKPMSSPFSILNRSAMPPSVKRITLVQMGVTMLRNTRPELHNELRVSMMEQLATKMMISGYPADFRRGVIESAVKCYEAQLAASVSGEKPLYRPRTWQQEGRRQKKMVSKMAWFRPADTVLRVPFTPDSELAKGVRAVVEEEATRLGLKVKVVEGGGVPLKRQITTSDLGAGKPCPQGNCLFCTTGDGKGGLSHHRRGAVYSGECKLCHQMAAWRQNIGESPEILDTAALLSTETQWNTEEKTMHSTSTSLSTTQMKISPSHTSNSLYSKHIINPCTGKPASPATSTTPRWTSQ